MKTKAISILPPGRENNGSIVPCEFLSEGLLVGFNKVHYSCPVINDIWLISRIAQDTTVGSYDSVLVMARAKSSSFEQDTLISGKGRLKPDAEYELKYYARHVGMIREELYRNGVLYYWKHLESYHITP